MENLQEAVTEPAQNSVRKVVTKTAVKAEKIYTTEFQKEGTKTCQLRQVVTTKSYYPSKQIKNNLQDNPFNITDFGFEEQEYTQNENRVAWVDVPAAVESVDDVEAKLPAEASLYRIMSNRPILTTNQVYAIDEGLRTMDDFANSQIVRYGENTPEAGQLVLDNNGKPQYRQVFYSSTLKEDVDKRSTSASDFYASEAIKAEMMGAQTVADQTI